MDTDTQLVAILTVITGIMAMYGWTRGVLTSFRAVGSWAAGIAAGIWAFGNGQDALAKYAGIEFGTGLTTVNALILAVVTFVGVRWLIKVSLNGLFGEDGPLEGFFRGPSGALLSLIPTLAITLLFCFLVRWMGTSVELHRLDQAIATGKDYTVAEFPKQPLTLRMRDSIERVPNARIVLDSVDPLSRTAQRNLAALLISKSSA